MLRRYAGQLQSKPFRKILVPGIKGQHYVSLLRGLQDGRFTGKNQPGRQSATVHGRGKAAGGGIGTGYSIFKLQRLAISVQSHFHHSP